MGLTGLFANTHSIIIATLWMVGTLFSFVAMAIGGRELSAELTTFQILFFRSLIGLFIVSCMIFKTGTKQVCTRHPGLHFIRNIAHFAGQFGWFYGISTISLATVFAIEFTLPVWTALMAAIILNEKLTPPRIMAVILGLVGMLIILRPGLGGMHLASLAVLAGAVCFGLSHTLTKKITQYDSPLIILFFMVTIQLPIGFCLSISHWHTPSVQLWPWLVIVGATGLSAHYCMARAFSIAQATVVVPMDFLRLPLITLVGFFFYNETIDGFVFLGAVVMLIGNLINIRSETKKPDK